MEALAVGVPGDYVDDPAHGVGAVEDGCRPSQYFYALDIFSLVEVRHMVGVDAGELRLPVDHHEHGVGGGAADSTYLDAARAASADAEAEVAALGDEETGHLSGDCGEQLGLSACGYPGTAYGAHGVGQQVAAHGVVAACDHDFVEGVEDGGVGDGRPGGAFRQAAVCIVVCFS